MPTHKHSCCQGLLHVRMSQVNHTFERLRQLFRQDGDGEVLGLFERMVDGMYGVEAYVQFCSRWAAARARDALDGHALYDGCCVLTVDHVPPIYTTITTPDDDGLAREYFYDDTPYDEWAAALALAERQYTAPASSNALAIDPKLSCTSESTSFHPSSPLLPHAPAAVPLDSAPVPVCTASTTAPTATPQAASTRTTMGELTFASSPPTMCSTVCEDIDIVGELSVEADTDQVVAALLTVPVLVRASPTPMMPPFFVHESEPPTPTRCPTESFNVDTPVATPASALGTCSSTIMARAYSHFSLMPHTAAVLGCANVEKVDVPQLFVLIDSTMVTKTHSIGNLVVDKNSMQMVLWQWHPPDRTKLSGMISGLLLPPHVSQIQSRLSHKESTCCLQVGKLQEFMMALFTLMPWPSFVLYSNGSTFMFPLSSTQALPVDGSEHFPWVIAWFPRDSLSCSSMVSDQICNAIVVPMFRHENFVQLVSYFAASRCVPVNKYLTMKCNDAVVTVQEKEECHDECIIKLVAILDTEQMQWQNP
ncbi:hypothetical protein BRADI_1g69463v3 [Brachypodium distachyon]|uniref:PTBP1-like RNA recognition motif 2 domain-containing protein n=1 Tax=Brachypodium distachyon TaxID=15368 RepID=A0A0Q3HJD6_BRADI|nr:hypothetical protein BRADI_1g69463v3 [Brachypodium distachyon]